MADGGYRGNPEVIIPYRRPRDGSELRARKVYLNTQHRTVRAQVEHALAGLRLEDPARPSTGRPGFGE